MSDTDNQHGLDCPLCFATVTEANYGEHVSTTHGAAMDGSAVPAAIRERHAALNRLLYVEAHKYYCLDDSQLSDAIFDQLKHEMLRYQEYFPVLVTRHSYGQMVDCPHYLHSMSPYAPSEWRDLMPPAA